MDQRRFTHTLRARMGGAAALLFSFSSLASTRAQAQNVFSATGVNAAAIQTTVDGFRTALGTLNPNTAGAKGSGRREINWDGVPESLAAPNALPNDFFNTTSPRGIVYSTPGTGFQVSGNTAGNTLFANLDASYPTTFAAFSGARIFTPIASNITDVNFFVPGLTAPATTKAFGVVFSDVDFNNATSLEFFDIGNNSLGKFFAQATDGAASFSFLGVQFGGATEIGRVRITTGTGILSAHELSKDLVAMDDFIYAEPTAQVVPEPATFALMAAGLAAVALGVRRKRAV